MSTKVSAPAAPTSTAQSQSQQRPQIQVSELIEDHTQRRVLNSQTGKVSTVAHIKRYNRGKYLGKGGFAKCYEIISQDSHRSYACKVISKLSLVKESSRKKLMNEINIHKSIQHRNVVKFERFFEDKTNVYILLEICENQTLMELVKRRGKLTESETQFYMWQLVNTVQSLHELNIIHRDLKLGNLFLHENMEIKLGDFGLATQLTHPGERKRTICGTPNYIAPEILDNSNGHSFEVDTWAMGVIMYTLLIGQPPFETTSVKTTYKKIRDNNYDFPSNVHISKAARSLIQRILHTNPMMRPALADVKKDIFFSQSPIPASLPISCLDTPLNVRHLVNDGPADSPADENENANKLMSPMKELNQLQAFNKILGSPNRAPLQDRQAQAQPKKEGDFLKRVLINSQVAAKPAKPTSPVVQRPATAIASPQKERSKEKESADEFRLRSARSNSAIQTAAAVQPIPTPTPVIQIPLVNPQPVQPSRVRAQTAGAATFLGHPINGSGPIAMPVKPAAAALTSAATASIDSLTSGLSRLGVTPSSQYSSPAKLIQIEGNDESDDDESTDSLKKIHDEIERSFSQAQIPHTVTASTHRVNTHIQKSPVQTGAPNSISATPNFNGSGTFFNAQANELWVNKWVDYSNKYGLGYLLSNGDSGVYFNDSSKAIMNAAQTHFDYIERRSSNGTGGQRQTFAMESFPAQLTKKVTLLKHFMNYLIQPKEKQHSNSPSPTNSAVTAAGSLPVGPELVYVKKWLRTKHAIFFRLSNRTVQVIFLDHTELVLSSALNSVTFTDKAKQRMTYSLDSPMALQNRPDLNKRMKYTKDILQHLLSGSDKKSGSPNSGGSMGSTGEFNGSGKKKSL